MVRLLNKRAGGGGLARRLVAVLLLLSLVTLGSIAVATWSWSADAAGHERWVLQAFGHKQRGFFVSVAAAPLDEWWTPLRSVCPASSIPSLAGAPNSYGVASISCRHLEEGRGRL